jgi:hypothetical protein
MNDGGTGDAGFLEAVARLGRLTAARDSGVLDEFEEDGILVGSEPGEIARGRTELAAFFDTLRAWPAAITWEWSRMDHTIAGGTGWFFAEGWVVARRGDVETRRPYRLSGVLTHDGSRWRWRLFSGSEPAVSSPA